MSHPSIATNTNPNEIPAHVLRAQGPFGFITSVFNTLQRFDRNYYFGAEVPHWFTMSDDGSISEEGFQAGYSNLYPDAEEETQFLQTPHSIIHQYRVYPASRRGTGTRDSASGSRRQKTPNQVLIHDQPLPESQGVFEEPEGRTLIASSPFSTTGERPPLWSSKDDVPDLLRDHIDENTVCYVYPWDYDVYVDFVIATPNVWLLEQMRRDLLLILRTFHDRSQTGQSNLSGFFYQDVPGTPPGIDIPKSVPTRTITWRLKQTEAYAFPAKLVDKIRIELHGDQLST